MIHLSYSLLRLTTHRVAHRLLCDLCWDLPSRALQLHLPLTTPLPGIELTKEPFRWDQRLFSLVLRIPGHASVEPEPLGGVPPDDSAITPMCEVTGGRLLGGRARDVWGKPLAAGV